MNQNRRGFTEYFLVLNPMFLSSKEHQKLPRDTIGGIEPLVVDILRFLELEVVFFGGKCRPSRQLRPETGESLEFF